MPPMVTDLARLASAAAPGVFVAHPRGTVGLEIGCIVPGQKSQLGLLEVGLASLYRRQAMQAQMMPLIVVIPQELF